MHDARALGGPARCAPSAQRTGERPLRTTCPGMDDDAGGLVDDEQMLVLPGDREACRLGFRLRLGRSCRWLEAHLLAAGEPVALRPSDSVDEHGSPGDEPFRRRTRAHGGLLREEPVQPQPRGRLGYAERDQERSVDAP